MREIKLHPNQLLDGVVLSDEMFINGTQIVSGRFVFDTGCRTTIISPKVAELLNIVHGAPDWIRGFGGAKTPAYRVNLDEVNWDGMVFKNVDALVAETGDETIFGFIGMNIFKGVKAAKLVIEEE